MKQRKLNAYVLALTRVLDVTGRRRNRAWPVVPEGDDVLFPLAGLGFVGRGRDDVPGLEEGRFPVLVFC